MKKVLYAMLFMSMLYTTAQASHLNGGELYYEYNGSGYTVHYVMYRDCAGISAPNSIIISVASASLNSNMSLTLTRTSLQPAAPQCPLPNKCVSLTSNIPGYEIARYRGFITLPATSSDWVFSATTSARNSTNNISGGNLYLEATLNNSNGENVNAYTAAPPPLLLTTASTIVPIQTVDADGDSVVIIPVAPRYGKNNNASYSPGYSPTAPFGSSGTYTINNTLNQTMTLKSSMLGNFAVAYKVNEYRNGTLIASHVRDFGVGILASSGPGFTYPGIGNQNMLMYTCPGSIDSVSFTVIDPNTTDSVFVDVNIPTLPAGWSATTVVNYNAKNSATANLIFMAPANLNPQTLPYFYVDVDAYDNACPRAATKYTLLVKTRTCNADSVWPGDANSDKVVNLADPLAVALTFGQTGPARPSPSNTWIAQYANDWNSNIPFTPTDKKHADCNGNGVVGLTDLVPIATNWGLTHPKGTGSSNKRTGMPNLYFDMSGISFAPGATVDIPIKLGDATDPMNDFYGLGVRVGVTVAGSVPATQASITTTNSWVGGTTNTLEFNKDINNGTIDWAFARTDHNNVSGNGTIATLHYTIPANATDGDPISMTFAGALLIDKEGETIAAYNAVDATAYVVSVSVKGVSASLSGVAIVPNPSQNTATLQMALTQAQTLNITVMDITGKNIWNVNQQFEKGNTHVALPASNLSSGVYMINIQGADGTNQTLKWIKN